MRRAAKLVATLIMAAGLPGHDVITTPITFSREISRLFYSHCVSCHREGGTAFSLATYDAARPWAKAIEEEVLERRMPPWGAVKGFGEFQHDQGLTQEQIEVIADWAEGGAPAGDPKYLPAMPDYKPPSARAAGADGIVVDGTMTLKTAVTVSGIRARKAADGATFMAVATRPDGTVEPLLWLYHYKPQFDRAYWYTEAIRLPAGTRVEVTPRGAGGVALITRSSGDHAN
jgi:hypothetical protein